MSATIVIVSEADKDFVARFVIRARGDCSHFNRCMSAFWSFPVNSDGSHEVRDLAKSSHVLLTRLLLSFS
jgi:hypothetical protein